MTTEIRRDEPSALSKLLRRSRVFWLATQVFVSYKLAKRQESKLRRRLGLAEDKDEDDDHPDILALWDATHERNAKRILRSIEELQGFWIKMGQYLSSRADVMPLQYLTTLAVLQDGVPAKSLADIQQTLKEQWSLKQYNSIAHMDETPLSTASLAQVHRARLVDGRDVVLKVQHRGVATLMRQDMDNLRTILRMLAFFEPDLDYNPVVDEYAKEVSKELDFRSEATNMQEIKQLLEERQIRAIVPAAVEDLVTEKVLVMDYCEGFPIRDLSQLEAHNVDRRLLLERVVTSWAAQMHILATFNADPHAGNILVSTSTDQNGGDTSVPILLDFGLTKRLNPDMKVAFSRLVHSSYETDIDGLLQSFDEMGLKLNRYDPFQDMQAMQTSLQDTVPQSEAAAAKKQRAREYKERTEAQRQEQKKQKLRNPVDAWPPELIFFTRVSAMLRGLCSRLEVRYPYLQCMANAASETLRKAVPAHEHAAGTVYKNENAIETSLQQRLHDLALALIEDDHAIGMQVTVLHKSDTVANIAAGTLGTVNPRPVTPASLFTVFSVSKAVLAAGTLKLLQERGISVDDPIAKFWPEFGEGSQHEQQHPYKKLITIRHALSHQSGLADSFPDHATIETLTDWNHMKKFIAGPEAVPSHKPGTEINYHYLTFAWLLGGLIEAITGDSYEEYLLEHLIAPLGLEDELHMGGLPDEVAKEELAVITARTLNSSGSLSSGEQNAEANSNSSAPGIESSDDHSQPQTAPTDQEGSAAAGPKAKDTSSRARLAKFQGRQQLMNPSIFNMRQVRGSKIPSANGHASAHALATLMHALTTSDQILSRETMAAASTPQLPRSDDESSASDSKTSSAMLDNAQASFGLGFQIHELKRKSDGATVRSLGHSGFGGSILISVPEEELTIAFTTNQLKMKSVAKAKVLRAIFDESGLDAPKSLIDFE